CSMESPVLGRVRTGILTTKSSSSVKAVVCGQSTARLSRVALETSLLSRLARSTASRPLVIRRWYNSTFTSAPASSRRTCKSPFIPLSEYPVTALKKRLQCSLIVTAISSRTARIRRTYVRSGTGSPSGASPVEKDTGIRACGRLHPGAGHWRNNGDLLPGGRRAASPASLQRSRTAGVIRRSSGGPPRHVRQGARNRCIHRSDTGVFFSRRLHHHIV